MKQFFCSLIIASGFLLAWSGPCRANDLTISNVELTDYSSTNSTVQIEFDITWNNSWYNSTNYDAAWVFVKYSTDSGTSWSHATLKTSGTNPTNFSDGDGTEVDIVVPTDKKGAFIQRAVAGFGTLAVTDLQLVWDYSTDGLTSASSAMVRVFGIEMVFVPAGDYVLGSANSANWSENALKVVAGAGSGTGGTFTITRTSSAASFAKVFGDSGLTIDDDMMRTSGVAVDGDGGLAVGGTAGTSISNTSFPSGGQAHYVMKHEISQGMYRDFLNTLSRAQQLVRIASSVASQYSLSNSTGVTSKQGVRNPASTSGTIVFGTDSRRDGIHNTINDGEWVAMNYMKWQDLAAVADWAALRPMTELEFERVSRGSNSDHGVATTSPMAFILPHELPSAFAGSTVLGTSTESEAGNKGNLNAASALTGPLRVGSFANSTTTTMRASGASYYGALDLSGNVAEMVVTIGNVTGRSFAGTHGDGTLSTIVGFEGNATNSDWPGYSSSEDVSGSTGAGFRGGSWNESTSYSAINNRTYATTSTGARASNSGGRLARTA